MITRTTLLVGLGTLLTALTLAACSAEAEPLPQVRYYAIADT